VTTKYKSGPRADTLCSMPLRQPPKQLFALATAPQLMRQLQVGGQTLAELQRMLRTAWMIPHGKGEEAANAIWTVIIRYPVTGSAASPSITGQTAPSEFGLDDAQRLALLRTTFTEEAERLARWGMTPNLPAELRKLVAQGWVGRVTEVPDGMGRSRESLQRELGGSDHCSASSNPGRST